MQYIYICIKMILFFPSELDEFLLEMDEDTEGMQGTILYLQHQLRSAKHQLQQQQQQQATICSSPAPSHTNTPPPQPLAHSSTPPISTHRSNTPPLQHSITPPLTHSNTPPLQPNTTTTVNTSANGVQPSMVITTKPPSSQTAEFLSLMIPSHDHQTNSSSSYSRQQLQGEEEEEEETNEDSSSCDVTEHGTVVPSSDTKQFSRDDTPPHKEDELVPPETTKDNEAVLPSRENKSEICGGTELQSSASTMLASVESMILRPDQLTDGDNNIESSNLLLNGGKKKRTRSESIASEGGGRHSHYSKEQSNCSDATEEVFKTEYSGDDGVVEPECKRSRVTLLGHDDDDKSPGLGNGLSDQ